MNLTKKEVEDYKKILKAEPLLPQILQILTPKQRTFCNAVMAVITYPEMSCRDIAKVANVGAMTAHRAFKVVKGGFLPIRMSERMQCKLMELQFKGRDTELGLMTESALQSKFARLKRKERKCT